MADSNSNEGFSRWIARPETLVALSAIVLSVCGLAISIYEAGLIRQSQAASVWPFVQVGASMSPEQESIFVHNTGVGPARIQAANVSYRGETRSSWTDAMRELTDDEELSLDAYYSVVNGQVLPADSERESVFRLTSHGDADRTKLVESLRRAIGANELDVTLCYCSVYEECWVTRMQDVFAGMRGVESEGVEAVSDCSVVTRSGI